MKEKILALLTAKFTGVRKDGLARLAGAMALQVADETEAGTIVDKLTTEKVSEFVTEYRKDVDSEITNASKTHETNLKKKFDFVEKKSDEGGKDDKDDKSKGGNPEDVPAWAKGILESNKAMADELNKIKGEKVTTARQQQLQSKLEGVPETFKAQKLKDFSRMSFENDESFAEYLTEVETGVTAMKQELADNSLGGLMPTVGGGGDSDSQFASLMKAINTEPKKE